MIKIELDSDLEKRIDNGPLRSTGGRGKATWARALILRELDRLEGIGDGSQQARELATFVKGEDGAA